MQPVDNNINIKLEPLDEVQEVKDEPARELLDMVVIDHYSLVDSSMDWAVTQEIEKIQNN